MDFITSFLTLLNSLSPLAVIALLGVVIFLLVKNKVVVLGGSNGASKSDISGLSSQLDLISNNHLSDLPEIAETLRRLEIMMTREFSYLRTRLNGRNEV